MIKLKFGLAGCEGRGHALDTLHPQLDWRDPGAVSTLLPAGHGPRGPGGYQKGSHAVVSFIVFIFILFNIYYT